MRDMSGLRAQSDEAKVAQGIEKLNIQQPPVQSNGVGSRNSNYNGPVVVTYQGMSNGSAVYGQSPQTVNPNAKSP
jgi:hypothetical protein